MKTRQTKAQKPRKATNAPAKISRSLNSRRIDHLTRAKVDNGLRRDDPGLRKRRGFIDKEVDGADGVDGRASAFKDGAGVGDRDVEQVGQAYECDSFVAFFLEGFFQREANLKARAARGNFAFGSWHFVFLKQICLHLMHN